MPVTVISVGGCVVFPSVPVPVVAVSFIMPTTAGTHSTRRQSDKPATMLFISKGEVKIS